MPLSLHNPEVPYPPHQPQQSLSHPLKLPHGITDPSHPFIQSTPSKAPPPSPQMPPGPSPKSPARYVHTVPDSVSPRAKRQHHLSAPPSAVLPSDATSGCRRTTLAWTLAVLLPEDPMQDKLMRGSAVEPHLGVEPQMATSCATHLTSSEGDDDRRRRRGGAVRCLVFEFDIRSARHRLRGGYAEKTGQTPSNIAHLPTFPSRQLKLDTVIP